MQLDLSTADDGLDEQGGWLLIRSAGVDLTDDQVQALRDVDQR